MAKDKPWPMNTTAVGRKQSLRWKRQIKHIHSTANSVEEYTMRAATCSLLLMVFACPMNAGCRDIGSTRDFSQAAQSLMSVGTGSAGIVNVQTQHNDVARSGANYNETILSASTGINNQNFGELWRLPVVGQISGQPLYIGHYPTNWGTMNLLIVATTDNYVYAFDADCSDSTACGHNQPIWVDGPSQLGTPSSIDITNNKPTGHNAPALGVMSTPVVDTSAGIVYVMSLYSDGTDHFQMVAISLYSGIALARSPALDINTNLTMYGCADTFNPTMVLNRPALLESPDGQHVYAAFGSRSEPTTYHGVVISMGTYSGNGTLPVVSCYQTTTGSTNGGGIWQAGTGLADDKAGHIYFTSGNADYTISQTCQWGTWPQTSQYSLSTCSQPLTSWTSPATSPVKQEDSIVRLTESLGYEGSYFPRGKDGIGTDFQTLESCDADFGSSGPVLATSGGHSRLVSGGKAGQVFILDPTTLNTGAQGTNGSPPMTQTAFQATNNAYVSDRTCYDKYWPGAFPGPHIHGAPAFINTTAGDYFFLWGEKDYLRRIQMVSGSVATTPQSNVDPSALLTRTDVYVSNTLNCSTGTCLTNGLPPNGMPGGALSISLNGALTNGSDLASAIIWALIPGYGACGHNTSCDTSISGPEGIVTGDLLAIKASDLTVLWGTRNFHDTPSLEYGSHYSRPIRDYSKFSAPTVANGKVFVGTSGYGVNVYGLRSMNNTQGLQQAFNSGCHGTAMMGDVDGDGVGDMICHDASQSGKVTVWYGANNSTGFGAVTSTPATLNWCYGANQRVFAGDFDGDRRTDLLCHDFSAGQSTGGDWIFYSSGNRADPYDWVTSLSNTNPTWSYSGSSWCYGDSNWDLVVGDYNGDGRADLLCHHKGDSTTGLYVKLSTPGANQSGSNQFPGSFDWQSSFNWCSDKDPNHPTMWYDYLLAGDINGDGVDDLLCDRPSDGQKWVLFNNYNRQTNGVGSLFLTSNEWYSTTGWCTDFDLYGNPDPLLLQDMDGDGAADMVCHNTRLGKTYIMYGRPGSYDVAGCSGNAPFDCLNDAEQDTSWCAPTTGNPAPLMAMDVDGDNRADLVCHDRLASITNDQIEYYPISATGIRN